MTDYEAAYRRVVDRLDSMQDEIDRLKGDCLQLTIERDKARADAASWHEQNEDNIDRALAIAVRAEKAEKRVAELERWLDGVRTAMDE